MSLSSLIVSREVATMRQVEEALARQVIYGGDLATNLLEVALVDEDALTRLIADATRLTPAPPGELAVSPTLAALVPEDLAITRGFVPLKLEGEVLVLAVIEPMPADFEEQLMFSLGLAIDQRIAPAVRIKQAITRLYGRPLERRMQRLVARLAGVAVPEGSTPPLGSPVASVPPPTPAPSSPGHVTARGFPAAVPTQQSLEAVASGVPADSSRSLEAAAAAGLDGEAAPSGRAIPDSDPPSTPLVAEHPGLIQRDIPSTARAGRRRRGPVVFDDAKREAEQASDRNLLLDLFFDYSRQFFDYAALFLVHGDIAEGRDAFGSGADRERVVGIGVPLDLPSLMSNVRDDRVPLVAAPPPDGLDAVLLTDLQRPRDLEIAIVPLVVRTRAVALLLGDCAHSGIERRSIDHVTVFAGIVGKALERVIVRRKLEGFVASGKPAAAQEEPAPAAVPAAQAPERPAPRGQPVARIIPTSTMPPPPPNVVTVRKLSGPPIPREDPEEGPSVAPAFAAPPPPTVASVATAQNSRNPPDPPDPPKQSEPQLGAYDELDARALFDILGWETGAEEPELPPPSSAVAVPPHRPPPGYSSSPEGALPSVIVDMQRELADLVERVIRDDGDESAEGELLRQGERAMPVIMAQFPGPVSVDRRRIVSAPHPPRASECGPLLRVVARERRVALPFVIGRLSDPDPDTRGWATHLLCELPYPEAIPHALARLSDPDACTRASAALAVVAVSKVFPDHVRDAVKSLASAPDPSDRAAAMRTIAHLRQQSFVPDLLRGFADGDERVVASAHAALVQLTRHDLGSDARPWLAWWEQNASRHRVEWLIDALSHEVQEIRRAAGDELREVTREYFGYSSDLPARERDRAQQRYRDWWITEGRARFRKR